MRRNGRAEARNQFLATLRPATFARATRKLLLAALRRTRPRPRDVEAIIHDLEAIIPRVHFDAWLADAPDRHEPLAQLVKTARAFGRALRALPDDSAGAVFASTTWPRRWYTECGQDGWPAILDRVMEDVEPIERGAAGAPRRPPRAGRPRAGSPAIRSLATRAAQVLRQHTIRPSAYADGLLAAIVRALAPLVSPDPVPDDLTRILQPAIR
jgi:hypothetical protein